MTANRLGELETVIDHSRRSFYAVGKALYEIRENRLYKFLLYDTFDAYARNRWAMSKSHAYRLIEAYRIIENLSPIGDRLPENESQVRPLAMLTPLEQRNIWRQFLASGQELSASNISRFVSAVGKTELTDQRLIISDNYKDAVLAMMEQVRVAQNDGWQNTSKQAAIFWNRLIKDKILSKISRSDKP